jgi:SH3 domain protein
MEAGQVKKTALIKRIHWSLFLIILCLVGWQAHGLAETMYVTDRLYLSLRNTPNQEEPAVVLLQSDTKVEILAREGDWARVELEDGKTGWVLERYLVEDLPKSLIIEELKREVENKDTLLERLEKENASRGEEMVDRAVLEEKNEALAKEIETLRDQVAAGKKQVEVSTKDHTVKRLKEVYITGIVALFLGLIVGYMMRKPKKRQLFS